ncbi:hypothetical protein NDU88_003251 [Pleurodeles waltl]|uniref:Uncharacterized protein n=1 Tax=Pleurodeles waltl TaxID=8319 RepID=A0AAV7VCU5_PLEWA|nr:hypothetical protein NDU88_003251 [Pleurodeles waltl]
MVVPHIADFPELLRRALKGDMKVVATASSEPGVAAHLWCYTNPIGEKLDAILRGLQPHIGQVEQSPGELDRQQEEICASTGAEPSA